MGRDRRLRRHGSLLGFSFQPEVTVPRAAIVLCSCLVWLAAGAAAPSLAGGRGIPTGSRTPVGVYVKLDVESVLEGFMPKKSPIRRTAPAVARLHERFRTYLEKLVADKAVSGIAAGEHWDHIQLPKESYPYVPVDGYDWSYLDDVFAVADAQHLPVQINITPGADMPPKLLGKLTPCDKLFTHPKAKVPRDCGTAVFPNPPEAGHTDGKILPLPWNPIYIKDWDGFLRLLDERYSINREFGSIAVAGPVDGSPEMILPTSANTQVPDVDTMWKTLIEHAFPNSKRYAGNDEVFVDQWKQTIAFFAKTFRGVTLILTPDAGGDLPDLGSRVTPAKQDTLYPRDCAASRHAKDGSALAAELMSCEAKTEVIRYFLYDSGVDGKVTRVGGMRADTPKTLSQGDIGVAGAKYLTTLPRLPIPVAAGANFDFPVSGGTMQKEGCPHFNKGTCAGLTVETAAYNVLTVFFDDTEFGKQFGGDQGGKQVSFVEVPYTDVAWAEHNPCAKLQNLLDQASSDLTGDEVVCPK